MKIAGDFFDYPYTISIIFVIISKLFYLGHA
jgi:hypothetical protein